MPIFIVRYSEIGLKGPRKRSEMELRLLKNIGASLGDRGDLRIWMERGRIFLEVPDSLKQLVLSSLPTVFGIKSFSECTMIDFTSLEDLVDKSRDFFIRSVKSRKFAVRATRTGRHDFTSIDVERKLGEALLPEAFGVDLEHPDFTARLDIRERKAYLYNSVTQGAGGFPLGTQGRMVSLVSGGIDSPVAAWMMMKRGSVQDIVFCSLAHPIDTAEFIRSIEPLIDRWSHGSDPAIHIFNGTPLIDLMAVGKGFTHPNVGFKKFLYELAATVNRRVNGYGIVTGESLGQVSSQTAENLFSLTLSVNVPIYRPLIGFDKDEIVDLSKRIGTFPQTSLGEFCSIFAANPSISIREEDLKKDNVPEETMLSILKSEIILRKEDLSPFKEKIHSNYAANDFNGSDMIVVDLRSKDKFKSWHPEGSIHATIAEVGGLPDKYGKNHTFLFYCSKGLMSAYAASKLTSMGLNALFTDENKLKKMIEKKK